MDSLQISVDKQKTQDVLKLEGSLTGQSIVTFRGVVDGLEKANLKVLSFDMRSLKYIDSLGIGILIYYYNELVKLGVNVNISSPTDSVLEILELTSLDKVIPIIS
ncbi:STAS domain-containing protein [bacterium]|nr:STAS domain-containing protein [bacterium]